MGKSISIFGIILIILLSIIVYQYEKSNNLPSQCYTNLQPKNYFNKLPISPISKNSINKEITISYDNRELFADSQVASTGSMYPCIPGKSQLIEIRNITINDLNIGDIISVKRNGKKDLLHRIVEITDEGKFILKGDNNVNRDPEPFDFSVVNGKVVGILYSWIGLIKGGL